MAGKKQGARGGPVPTQEGFPRKRMELQAGRSEEETARNAAAVLTDPATAGFRVIRAAEDASGLGDILDAPALLERLREEARAVSGGDLAHAEAMLLTQATALQSLFARLVERGMGCTMLPAFEANLRLGLAAQRQSTRALEVLALYRQGPTVIARTANVAQNQQINVGAPIEARARTGPAESANGLLEEGDGARVVGGAQGAAEGANRVMAPLGEKQRPPHTGRQGEGV